MSSEQLLVRIDATTEQLRRELRQADQTVQRSTRSIDQKLSRVDGAFRRMGRAIGPLIGVAGASMLTRFSTQALDSVAAMNQQAQAAGVNVERFQELTKGFQDLGNVAESTTAGALRRFQRRFGLAAEGTGAAVDTLERLNITLEQDTSSALEQAITRLAQIDDGARRAAEASQLFGEDAGPALAGALGQGEQALQAVIQNLRETGRIMSEDMVEAGDELDRKWKELTDTIEVGFKSAVIGALDSMRDAADQVERAAEAQDRLRTGPTPVGAMGNRTRITPQEEQALQRLEALEDAGIGSLESVTNLGPDVDLSSLRQPIETDTGEDDDEDDDGPTDAEQAAERSRQSLQDLQGNLEKQVATFDEGRAAALEYRLTVGDLADDVERLGPAGEEMREQIIAQAEALDEQREKAQQQAEAERERQRLQSRGEQLTRQMLTAQEEHNARVEEYNRLLDAGAINQETFNRAVEDSEEQLERAREKAAETGEEMSEFAKQAASNTQDAFADFLFDPFQDGLDGMLDGFIRTFRRMAAEGASEQILGSLGGDDGLAGIFDNLGSSVFGGGSSGGSGNGWMSAVGSWFGGFFADGGSPPVGKLSVANERGPELFVPQTPGQIVSNEDAQEAVRAGVRDRGRQAQGEKNVTVYQTVNTPDARSFRKSSAEVTRELRRGARV